MEKKVETGVNKVKRKKKIKRIIKIILLILMLLLTILYIIFGVIYHRGSFSINLDKNLYIKNGIIIYEDSDYKVFRTELYAESIGFMDNISYKWLPTDLAEQNGGSHNGDNYIAYTFFVENLGNDITDYWTEVVIEDATKGVDEAVRVRVYRNGEYVTYGKMSSDQTPEKDTTPFITETLVARNHVEQFKPGNLDKYTIVLWVEGNDPECTDNILNGELKIYMDFKSEVISNEK